MDLSTLQSQRLSPTWEMDFEPSSLGQTECLWGMEEGLHDRALPSQVAVWVETGGDDDWDLDQQELWFGPEQTEKYLGPGNQTPRSPVQT